jgi:hypothetical protein
MLEGRVLPICGFLTSVSVVMEFRVVKMLSGIDVIAVASR